eukprot:7383974-Prymnesium_polylepis.3
MHLDCALPARTRPTAAAASCSTWQLRGWERPRMCTAGRLAAQSIVWNPPACPSAPRPPPAPHPWLEMGSWRRAPRQVEVPDEVCGRAVAETDDAGSQRAAVSEGSCGAASASARLRRHGSSRSAHHTLSRTERAWHPPAELRGTLAQV